MAQKLNFNCEEFHWKSFLLSFSGEQSSCRHQILWPWNLFCYMGDLGSGKLKLSHVTILDKLTLFYIVFRLLCKNLEWVLNPRQNYARAVIVDCSRWNNDKLFETSAIKNHVSIEKSNADMLRWYKYSSEIMRLYRNYCVFFKSRFF